MGESEQLKRSVGWRHADWFPSGRSWLAAVGLTLSSRALLWLFLHELPVRRNDSQPGATLLCRWDCIWYRGIIESGYSDHLQSTGGGDWAFFPAFPLLAGLLRRASGLSAFAAGAVVVLACFVVGLAFLHDYCSRIMSREAALAAVAFVAFSPFSIFLSSAFSEGLFFLLTVLLLACAHHRAWTAAIVVAALLSATRPTGLVAVIVIVVAMRFEGERISARRLLAVSVGGASGLIAFMVFQYLKYGDPLAFIRVQAEWERSFRKPLVGIASAVLLHDPGFIFECLCLLLACFAALYLKQRGLYSEAIVLSLCTLVPAATALISIERFAFANAPAYIALALVTAKSRVLRVLVAAAMVAGMALFTVAWLLAWPVSA